MTNRQKVMSGREDREQIEKTLAGFIRDFNDLDLDKVSTYFAEDATIFPRVVMSGGDAGDIDLSHYLREEGPGPDSSMREFARERKAGTSGPPYMKLEPRDVMIQLHGEVAVVTFHLLVRHRLSRRTLVLLRRDAAWKIIHLHASNVHGGC